MRSKEGDKTLPPLKFDYLLSLIDDTGIFQHCRGKEPLREYGYTTDDASRALLVLLRGREQGSLPTKGTHHLSTLFSFLLHAQREDGWFRNYLSPHKEWLDREGSEDCFGRALWTLAKCYFSPASDLEMKSRSKEALEKALPWVKGLQSPRGRALSSLALATLAEGKYPGAVDLFSFLSQSLLKDFHLRSSPHWQWFEEYLTYANACLPHALYSAYNITGEEDYLNVAEKASNFLWKVTFDGKCFVPPGNRGWHVKGKGKDIWDQQPLEAGCSVEEEVEAFKATGKSSHLRRAWICLQWFLGRNVLGKPLYEPDTGACHDGLGPQEVNENCGAEATISFLSALQAINDVSRA